MSGKPCDCPEVCDCVGLGCDHIGTKQHYLHPKGSCKMVPGREQCSGVSPRRALTVRQPWARLILMGDKTIEVRSHFTWHRGPLLIHAGGTIDPNAPRSAWRSPGDALHYPRGAVVAEVHVLECRPFEHLDVEAACLNEWKPDHYAWVLGKARPVYPPLHIKGQQGLWKLPPEAAEQLVEDGR